MVETLRSYAALTKPRILPMVIFTALPVLGMAGAGAPGAGRAAAVLVGIAGVAAAANALNMVVERDRDARMERTRGRPLPAGRLEPGPALAFAVVLGAVSTAGLAWAGGALAAGLGVAAILFYVFVYTVWLKPRSVWNAVLGAAPGASAPLIADAAVNGSVGWPGLLLFAVVFFWQPPHVWAIALYRAEDYAAGGIPMLPAVVGEQRARRHVVAYAAGLVPLTLLPVPLGLLGAVYGAAALALGAWFVIATLRLLRERTDAAARRVFRVSLAYLGGLYAAMLADLFLG